MKKYLFIVLFVVSSKVFSANGTINGGGLSSFGGTLGFNVFREFDGHYDEETKEQERYFIGLGGSFPWEIGENNTYDIDEDLFNDVELGKQNEFIYLFGGRAVKMDDRQTLYLGLGYTYATTYSKRKDEFKILGNGGIYYIKDEKEDTYSPSGTIGLMIDSRTNILRISKYGFILNLSDSPNYNFVVLWQ